MVSVSRIADLAARCLYAFPDRCAGFDEVPEGDRGDFVEILQDELAHIAVEQGLRGHVAGTTTLVDPVGNDQEDLRLRDASGHRMREKDVASVGDHSIENDHDLLERICEPLGGDVPALLDVVPVELVVLPALQRHVCEQVGRRWAAGRSVEIEAGHHRDVDDLAAQPLFGGGEFLGVQRSQRVVLVAPSDRDPHDFHARPAGFVKQASRVSATEQFAEEDENISFAKDAVFGKSVQCDRVFHTVSSLVR